MELDDADGNAAVVLESLLKSPFGGHINWTTRGLADQGIYQHALLYPDGHARIASMEEQDRQTLLENTPAFVVGDEFAPIDFAIYAGSDPLFNSSNSLNSLERYRQAVSSKEKAWILEDHKSTRPSLRYHWGMRARNKLQWASSNNIHHSKLQKRAECGVYSFERREVRAYIPRDAARITSSAPGDSAFFYDVPAEALPFLEPLHLASAVNAEMVATARDKDHIFTFPGSGIQLRNFRPQLVKLNGALSADLANPDHPDADLRMWLHEKAGPRALRFFENAVNSSTQIKGRVDFPPFAPLAGDAVLEELAEPFIGRHTLWELKTKIFRISAAGDTISFFEWPRIGRSNHHHWANPLRVWDYFLAYDEDLVFEKKKGIAICISSACVDAAWAVPGEGGHTLIALEILRPFLVTGICEDTHWFDRVYNIMLQHPPARKDPTLAQLVMFHDLIDDVIDDDMQDHDSDDSIDESDESDMGGGTRAGKTTKAGYRSLRDLTLAQRIAEGTPGSTSRVLIIDRVVNDQCAISRSDIFARVGVRHPWISHMYLPWTWSTMDFQRYNTAHRLPATLNTSDASVKSSGVLCRALASASYAKGHNANATALQRGIDIRNLYTDRNVVFILAHFTTGDLTTDRSFTVIPSEFLKLDYLKRRIWRTRNEISRSNVQDFFSRPIEAFERRAEDVAGALQDIARGRLTYTLEPYTLKESYVCSVFDVLQAQADEQMGFEQPARWGNYCPIPITAPSDLGIDEEDDGDEDDDDEAPAVTKAKATGKGRGKGESRGKNSALAKNKATKKPPVKRALAKKPAGQTKVTVEVLQGEPDTEGLPSGYEDLEPSEKTRQPRRPRGLQTMSNGLTGNSSEHEMPTTKKGEKSAGNKVIVEVLQGEPDIEGFPSAYEDEDDDVQRQKNTSKAGTKAKSATKGSTRVKNKTQIKPAAKAAGRGTKKNMKVLTEEDDVEGASGEEFVPATKKRQTVQTTTVKPVSRTRSKKQEEQSRRTTI